MDIYSPESSSFLPVLTKVLLISEGPVLELGTGSSSTPFIHWLCLQTKRKVITYESNSEAYNYAKKFANGYHEIYLVSDWDKIPIENNHWGVAFIDHTPESRRKIELERLSQISDYVIIHDTDARLDRKFGSVHKAFELFRYCYNYRRQSPYTSVLSNFIEFTL